MMKCSRPPALFMSAAVIALAACSGTATEPTADPDQVMASISPESSSAGAGTTIQSSASVAAAFGPHVTWSVEEPGGGTVTAAGLYTAPLIVGLYHVVATSVEDPSLQAVASISVTPAPLPSGPVITVAKDGSGNYQTIQAAANAATPGTTVVVRPGTYREAVTIKNSGTASAPITFRADPGVYLDGENARPTRNYYTGLVTVSNVSYVTVSGFNVKNSASYGIFGQSSQHVTIQGGSVDSTVDGGIIFQGGSSITVDGVEVVNTNIAGGTNAQMEAISMSGVAGCEVKNCHVHDCKEEGIDIKDGSSNALVHHNDVHGMGSVQIYVDTAKNVQIYANRVHRAGSGTYLIAIASEAGATVQGVSVFDNLLYDTPYHAVGGFWSATGYSNIQIVNNTFYGIGYWAVAVNTSAGMFSGTNVIRNNIFRNVTKAAVEGSGYTAFAVDHNVFQTGLASATYGSSAVTTSDVQFVNGPAYDFHIPAGSPAVGAGTASLAPAVDFAGVARTPGIDAGAYQH